MNSKISVITAVFNNRDTVAVAIDSVLSQDCENVELIVIDGGSTDGTLDVLKTFADQIGVLVSEPDQGIYDALNKGIQHATGDVVGFLHSDDLFNDNQALIKIATAFEEPRIDATYGDLVYVRKNDLSKVVRYWRAGAFSPIQLRRGWMPPHPTFYVRRSVYTRLGGFDLSYRIAADYDCMLRFLKHGVHLRYVPEVLVRMRMGGTSNRSPMNLIRKSAEDLRALRSNSVGGFGTLLLKNVRKLPQFFRE